jgi:hypothetical protein
VFFDDAKVSKNFSSEGLKNEESDSASKTTFSTIIISDYCLIKLKLFNFPVHTSVNVVTSAFPPTI